MATPQPPAVPPAPPIESPSADTVDLGVLLVHGIGEQAQGDTLTRFAEPIVEWIRDWLQRGATAGTLFASTPVEARLHPPLLVDHAPAHARVLVGTARDGKEETQEWLFAEAWWSPQVLRPPIPAFTSWLVTRGPWLLLFHLNQEWLTSPRWGRVPKIAIGIVLSVAWAVASLAINLALLAASLVALIPIGRLRTTVYAVLRALAGVVGDAYVQLRSPVQRTAFEEATLDGLRWLRPQCRRVAVIAHSQGAAVAHGALQRAGAPTVDVLLTVGSGITKLQALRYLERLGVADRIAGLLAAPFLVGAGVVWVRTRALGINDADTTLVAPAALALVGLALLATVWMTVRQALGHLHAASDRLQLTGTQPDLRWVDIVATHDPVPAGELTRYFNVPKLEVRRIEVLRSRLSDHTSYWGARASFMPVVAQELALCAGGVLRRMATEDARWSFAAAQRRFGVDLRVLRTMRILDIAALLLPIIAAHGRLIAHVERLRALLSPQTPFAFVENAFQQIETTLRMVSEVIADRPASWVRPAVDVGIAFMLLLLALLLWQRLTFAIWRAWSASRNEEVLRHPDLAWWRGQTWPQRVEQLRNWAVVNGSFVGLLLLPVLTSAAWSLLPGWLDEARVYRLLGKAMGVAFVVLMLLAWLGDLAEKADAVQRRWHEWRRGRTSWSWPGFRAGASRAIGAAMAVFIAWFTVGLVFTLPEILRPEVIIVGLLAIARALLELLDRVWRRLDATGASIGRKLILLVWPLMVGLGLAVLLAVQTHDPGLTRGLSVTLMIAAIGAGLTLGGLRLLR